MQQLLSDEKLDWDDDLSESRYKEWQNIVKQVNRTPVVSIPRMVGQRNSRYSLIAFTDASKSLYGVVIYIKDLCTDKVSYLSSKNRVVNDNLKKKTIPVLEFLAICLGVELLGDLYNELTGESTVVPISIESLHLFTDSMVSVQWIRSYVVDYAKMPKKSVFVINRLKDLVESCKTFPITFDHINGKCNPADYVSRETSYKQLANTNFYSGPEFLQGNVSQMHGEMAVTVPDPLAAPCEEIPSDDKVSAFCHSAGVEEPPVLQHVVELSKYSSLTKLMGVFACVLKFVHLLKQKVRGSHSVIDNVNFKTLAFTKLVHIEQRVHHSDLCHYFNSNPVNLKDVPQMVNNLNLIREDGLIRVKNKFPRSERGYPVLLPKKSSLTEMMIRDCHENMAHIGTYTVLRELRPYYYIPHCYSMVRRVLKNCIKCRKLQAKSIEVNQNDYRSFRLSPKETPFANVFLDYAGPFTVKEGNANSKVWLLIITCCWSRAINIKVCDRLDVSQFLRAIQLHIYDEGLFSFCSSDLGSQICSGSRVISDFLDDMETVHYLQQHGVQRLEFCNFPKGNSALGSLVESCVKQVKLLIKKSVGKSILTTSDFQFIVAKVIHLINRRPIAFKDSLRSLPDGEIPTAVTPEMLTRGRELVSVNVIPRLHPSDQSDPYWSSLEPTEHIKNTYDKLEKISSKLSALYHSEFLATLTEQAVNQKDRYKRVNHQCLCVGDIVLLEEKLLKQSSYPMGVVISTEKNNLGEVTAARVKKGLTGEIVYRHSSSLIYIMSTDPAIESKSTCEDRQENSNNSDSENVLPIPTRKRRKTALICEANTRNLVRSDLI